MLLSGGLDLIFKNQKELQVDLKDKSTIKDLVTVLISQYAHEKKEMFAVDNRL